MIPLAMPRGTALSDAILPALGSRERLFQIRIMQLFLLVIGLYLPGNAFYSDMQLVEIRISNSCQRAGAACPNFMFPLEW
jgi:hypothetical protein